MDPREELIALRRMAELEAKAGAPESAEPSYLDRVNANSRMMRDGLAGMVRGAGSIGATLMAPIDAGARALGVQNDFIGRTDRRAAMDGGLRELGADTDSTAYGGGKLAAEVLGTLGVGGVLAAPVKAAAQAFPRAAAALAPVGNALSSAGMKTGAALGRTGDLALRAGAGGAVGGASVALVDPEQAATGAAIGAVLPPAIKGAGMMGNALGKGLTGGPVAAEVQNMARLAKDKWGIDIPADRIASSKPLNSVASALNYIPFSGRQAVEDRMVKQLDTALSTTFGQNSSNVTMALRKAQDDLGAKFDATLQRNAVNFDKQLLDDIGAVQEKAARELPQADLHVIDGQINELVKKGGTGQIEGQAAYNIKKDLDRIGRGNGNEAFHARELKKVLMGALDRSLGPAEASAFKVTRQHYGNMLDLENLAQNGAEGGVSVARLANMKHIGNPDMQELADIAAQFVKARESQHSAGQRGWAGLGVSGLGLGLGGPVGAAVGLGGAAAAGRSANALLDSRMLKNALMAQPKAKGPDSGVNQLIHRTAPILGSR